MATVGTVAECLEQFAPAVLAEDWDNVGLLVGSREWPVERIMTCLTVTPDTVAEAIAGSCQLDRDASPASFSSRSSRSPPTQPWPLAVGSDHGGASRFAVPTRPLIPRARGSINIWRSGWSFMKSHR